MKYKDMQKLHSDMLRDSARKEREDREVIRAVENKTAKFKKNTAMLNYSDKHITVDNMLQSKTSKTKTKRRSK